MNPSSPPPEPPCPTCGNPPASLIEDGYSIDLTPWWKHYLQRFNPFRLIRRKTEFRWQPIDTAPRDGKAGILIAKITNGEVVELDYDAIWTSEYKSWEVYWHWASANGSVEEPTHWCPMPAINKHPFP